MEEPNYSAEWFHDQAIERNLTFLPLRRCSLCGTLLGYVVHKEYTSVAFDSNCGCVSYETAPRPTGWAEVAETVTRQSTPEIRKRVADTLLGLREPV